MARALKRVLGAAVLLLTAAVAFAPASLLDRPLAHRTANRLRLADTEGVWWNGRAMLASADGAARMPIRWRVDIAPLLGGAIAVRLIGADPVAPSGTIVIGRSRTEIRDLHVQLPAAFVAAADARLRPFALGGGVVIDASFVSTDAARTGTANAIWNRARIAFGDGTFGLGTVSLAMVPTGNGFTATIRNVGGELALDGTLQDRAGALDVVLAITPTANASERARHVLPLLGQPDGAGGVRVAWRG